MFTYLKPKTEEEIITAVKNPSMELNQLLKICRMDGSIADVAAETIVNKINLPMSNKLKTTIKKIYKSSLYGGENRDLEIMLHYVYPSETED